MLKEQTKAPEFSLADQQGTVRTLAEFLGSYVLVYFYPKDDTPGCTKEACMIAEAYDQFKEMGVTVIGISKDSPESHQLFAEKYHLPFTLLSDPKKEAISAYEADGMLFTSRISYLIDPKGMIVKTYPKVDPASHAATILNDIKKFL